MQILISEWRKSEGFYEKIICSIGEIGEKIADG
jgi:hypothetical protein